MTYAARRAQPSILTAVVRLLLFSVPLLCLASPVAAESGEITLTTPVRQTLQRIQEDWQAWKRGYYQNNRQDAASALASLRVAVGDLGMQHLPELAAAAAAYAHRSASGGNYTRAGWALEDARALDPMRPEIDLVRSSVAWRQGDYIRSSGAAARGLIGLFSFEATRTVLVHNLVLWLVLVLLVAGACFVVIQMAVKGADLIADLMAMLAPLPQALALVIVVALLIWPLLLPASLLWLLLYWTLLLFGYLSASERVVVVVLLLSLGAVPVGLRVQQRAMELTRSPPSLLLSAIASDRLYSGLFADLEVMRGLLGDHPAVIELEADLHRRLGQWELARLRWGTVAEQEPANGASLNNLGVYNLRKQDFRSAIGYLERATEAEPNLVEGFFNLNQAYSGSYAFGESHEALAQAQQIDRSRVDEWLEEGDSSLAIPVEGSARRYGEIRSALLSQWSTDSSTDTWSLLRRELDLPIVIATLLAAIALHVVRRRFGYSSRLLGGLRSKHTAPRLLRALVPGWRAAELGHGASGAGMIALVVALVVLPAAGHLRYHLPIQFDFANRFLLAVAILGLLLFVVVRLGQEFAAEGRR